jgi:RNA polymerase sigma factor (sigma-70 family)
MNEHSQALPDSDVRLLRRRDPGAVERWFLAFADPLYTFVFYRVGRDADLAADVVQETFLSALGRIEDFDPRRGAMLSWLTYLSRNPVRSALRQRSRSRDLGAAWEEIDRRLLRAWREIETAPLQDEVLERHETADLVRMALANLPEDYRQALRQHYCQRRSLAEIARLRETTEGTVKSLLHRARAAFRVAFLTIAESLEGPSATGRITP